MPNFSIDGIDELRELVQKAQQQQETLVEVAYLRGYLDGMEGRVIVEEAAPHSKETPMTELKPGEFIGQDGRRYRVNAVDVDGVSDDNATGYVWPGECDFPAALAALNALHEESQRVIIPLSEHYRVVRDKDGERVEHRWDIQGTWVGFYGQPINAILAALHYREGE